MENQRIRVLDLYAGVGGAGKGYSMWADVVSVDIAPQPDNPFEFHRSDAIEYLEHTGGEGFDLIHASSPCQFDAAITKGTNKRLRHRYPDLYSRTKAALEATGKPYVIETPAARPDVVLCGEMFGLKVIRHRNFELGGWKAEQPQHIKHRGRVAGMRHGEWFTGPYFAVYGNGGGKGTVPQWQDAMGIGWTDNRKSIAEAIPPAYTQYIGTEFLKWKETTS